MIHQAGREEGGRQGCHLCGRLLRECRPGERSEDPVDRAIAPLLPLLAPEKVSGERPTAFFGAGMPIAETTDGYVVADWNITSEPLCTGEPVPAFWHGWLA
ncbi:MAG: hypothetical protein WD556_11475 [Actinomycetota bacterium]